MKKNIIMMVVLAILILISVVQAVQLVTLNSKLSEGGVSLQTSTKTSTSGDSQGAKLPSSLDNLPQMVGGC